MWLIQGLKQGNQRELFWFLAHLAFCLSQAALLVTSGEHTMYIHFFVCVQRHSYFFVSECPPLLYCYVHTPTITAARNPSWACLSFPLPSFIYRTTALCHEE